MNKTRSGMQLGKRLSSMISRLSAPIGLGLIICSAGYLYIEQGLNKISIVLCLLGALLLLIGFNSKSKPQHLTASEAQGKRVIWSKRLVLTAISSGSVIALLVFVNYFAARSPYRWDVTQYNQHTLTQATIEFVEKMQPSSSEGSDQAIEMIAFYVGVPPKYLVDLLNEYQRVSKGNITTKIVDPILDIAYAAKYGNVINGEERKLIVVSGDNRKDIDFSDAPLGEEQVTNGLTRVARESRQVYFLSGHSERSPLDSSNQGFSLFAGLLSSNNISSKSLMLGVEQAIPEDCDVLVIAGPRSDLTQSETELVQNFLEQGGDALFLIEDVTLGQSQAQETAIANARDPSLNNILNQWGIHIGNDTVVDLNSHIGGDVGSPATRNYVSHKAITEGLDYTFYLRPRSIVETTQRREGLKLAPIAYTASEQQSWAETSRTLKIAFDEGEDIPGPIAIAYVIWEEKTPTEVSDTRIITFTDADFLSNAYLNQYSNAAMGLNLINWLSELDYAVFLDQKDIKVERLDLTSKQVRIVTITLLLMPLLIGSIGLLVWIRRRYTELNREI